FIINIIKNEKPKKTELIDIDKWILTKYSKLVNDCKAQMDNFNYSQTMKDVEYFLWHELADHYIEMIKSSIYENKNVESIKYTLYTLGLGTLKLFAPFFPHITEEIYQNFYKKFEEKESIHITSWPEPIIIDEEKEKTGEMVKKYISMVRSWKSEQKIALNAPINTIATYASEELISSLKANEQIIKTTLKYPKDHKFVVGKPEIEEKIIKITPVYSKIGPTFKQDGKKIINWISKNHDEIIKKIEKDGDIKVTEIPGFTSNFKEGLIKQGFVQIKKDFKLKGKKDSIIISFEDFYLEFKGR
ncbi:MAG: class I tRNA ligase family protein, partial [Candidatus Thermoplasmatota archaeon]|nr:class I tRNA ligase family protein [Candidatus Thermoplasmatota archaeon]